MSFDQLPNEILRIIFDDIVFSSQPFLQLRLLCRRVDSIILGHILDSLTEGDTKWKLRRQPLTRSKIEMAARLTKERVMLANSNSSHRNAITGQITELVDGIAKLSALKPHIDDVGSFRTKYQLALAYTVVGSVGTQADEWQCPATWESMIYHAWGTKLSCPQCLSVRDLEMKMPPNDAALVVAASAGSIPDMAILLGAGADVNFEAGRIFGRALHVAAFAGHDTAVRWLLEHGADPNLHSFKGYTALHLAAVAGHASIVQILLDSGADPNKKDDCGRTPLLYATMAGNSSVTKTLLARDDTNPNLTDGEMHTTALVEAVFRDHEDIVRQLVERKDVDMNALGPSKSTPIFCPTLNGNESMLKLLLSRPDVDVNQYNDHDLTPLADAILAGEENLAKLLLTRKDLDVEMGFRKLGVVFPDKDCPALAIACYVGLTEVVRAILERENVKLNSHAPALPAVLGEDLPEHATPLTLAVLGGHKNIVALLLKHPKIEPDYDDCFGCTPLVTAVIRGHVPIVKMILKHPEVDINLPNFDNRTALIEAVSAGYEIIVQILCESEFLEPNDEDLTGQTALMIAASKGKDMMVKTLLRNCYIETHQENTDGVTALTVAVDAGHDRIVQMLLNHRGFSNQGPKMRHVMDALVRANMLDHPQVARVLADYIRSFPEGTFNGAGEHEVEAEPHSLSDPAMELN